MIGKYTGEALATYETIHPESSYTPNKLYLNKTHDIMYYINEKGYMHIYGRSRNKKNNCYWITDSILTKENTLKEISSCLYTSENELHEKILKMITEAEII